MSRSSGDSFRSRTLSERIVAALPAGGRFGALRRRLKPLFAKWLASGGGGLQSVLPGGEVVLVSPEYRHLTWNRDEYNAFRGAVRAKDVVLEAGANVGAYTLLFAQWTGASGRVFAFEPDPIAYAGLLRHIALNGMIDRVTAVAAAVSDGKSATLRFAIGDSSGISRLLQPGENNAAPANNNTRDVRAVSIDQFCAEHRLTPSVIKVDVEGAELAVLRGARSTIAAAGPGLQLFVEMHPHLWPRFDMSVDDVRGECDAQGLVAEALDGRGDDVWRTEGVCLRLRPRRA
jgi:FkbM family methyltransferase